MTTTMLPLEHEIIGRTLRVPKLNGPTGDATAVTRQFDAALLTAGFTLSAELRAHLTSRNPATVMDKAVQVLGAVRRLVGDHVSHNAYFLGFPSGVPDTVEFWAQCLREALSVPLGAAGMSFVPLDVFNLLDLPTYGTYQHTYTELLAVHNELVPGAKDRVTVLHLGAPLAVEAHLLYLTLAGSTVPPSEADRALLAELALVCVDDIQPQVVPVRENLAIINTVRLAHDRPLRVGTVTDVLRVACAASGGDVTLSQPTRFASFRRSARRGLLEALNGVVAADPAQLGDVARYRERFKRLGERLHPHEYPNLPHAGEVFAVARGERIARSLASRVEHAFDAADVSLAVSLLSKAPGMLLRNTDRILRVASPAVAGEFVGALLDNVGGVSGRVLLSLREHLTNRFTPDTARAFVNQAGRSWVTPDDRAPLDPAVVKEVTAALDQELERRLPAVEHLVVDAAVLGLALPLSGKSQPGGFGVMPRGSVTPVEGHSLRFFIHWRQRERQTDYDLSVLLLDREFSNCGQLSWTSLRGYGGAHSGDIVDAPGPDGASEFIDLHLPDLPGGVGYIVPQVHLYSGETFAEVEESFFGYMTRDRVQAGMPFEPRTVRMRSDLRVPGRVALPLMFSRDGDRWVAKWAHLHLTGMHWANRVEANRLSTALLARGVINRSYLTVHHLVALMARKVTGSLTRFSLNGDREPPMPAGPVTYIGIDQPEGLPDGSDVYTLSRLHELIPR